MKTVLMLPSEAECDVVVKDQQGRPVKIGSIEVTPTFYSSKAVPSILFFETRLDDYIEEDEDNEQTEVKGQLLQRGAIMLAGSTGTLKISDRTKSVKSHFEAKLEEEEEKMAADIVAMTESDSETDEPIVRRSKKRGR